MFSRMIVACEQSIEQARSASKSWFRSRKRGLEIDVEIPTSLRQHYEILLDEGKVVWGATAQVNSGMFSEGSKDLPGVTIYSPHSYFDDHPQDLALMGRAAYSLKNTEPTDPELQPLAARLTDEYDATARTRLPNKLTDGRKVYIGTTLFHRKHLPGGVLSASIFPLLIAPSETDVNMVLPLRFWSASLRVNWHTLDAELSRTSSQSSAWKVAQEAEKRPARPRPVGDHLDMVHITPRAARVIREHLESQGMAKKGFVAVGVRLADGHVLGSVLDLGDQFNAEEEESFECNGIRVVIRKDQLIYVRGATVDFRDSVYGSGFVVRLSGE